MNDLVIMYVNERTDADDKSENADDDGPIKGVLLDNRRNVMRHEILQRHKDAAHEDNCQWDFALHSSTSLNESREGITGG